MTQTPTRDQIQQGWDSVASGFDTHTTPRSIEWAKSAFRHIDIGPGRSLLDVGAGTGALSIPAARLGARVTAVDISPTMIELLNKRARSEGLEVETHVMDGTDLHFDDETFDVVSSLNGVSTFADAAAGLAEMARVTRPGGQVQVIAFGALDKAEWLTIFLGVMAEVGSGSEGLLGDGPPPPFQFADRDVFRGHLEEAGLSEVRVVTQHEDLSIASGKAHWDLLTSSNPIGAQMVSGLNIDQKAWVIATLDKRLAAKDGVLSTQLNVGIGTRI